jgi:hypothetical protein
VEGEHDQDDHGPQVIEGEAGAGQGGRARHANQIQTSQIELTTSVITFSIATTAL